MVRNLGLLAAAAVVLTSCGGRSVDVVSGGEVVAAVPANANTLPAGTTIQTRLDQTLSTENSRVGDTFTATVTNSVIAQNGEVVVPAGAVVTGRVTNLRESKAAGDRALIQLTFDRLSFGGRNYDFGANVTNVATVEQRNRSTGEIIQHAAAGAAVGGVIGGIISGGDLQDIIKGGLLGAAAGTVISLGMGDVEHRIPQGTPITIQATQTVALR